MPNISEALVGAWKLVTFEFRKKDGSVIYPFGEKARGSIIYTEAGRYSAQLMRLDRPKFVSGDQMQGTAEEMEASYKGCISYFGTYEIQPEDGLLVHYVEASIFPNMEGSRQKRFFELSGKRLQLKTPPIRVGGERAVGVLLWEKVD